MPPVDTRPVTRAILESGYVWEEEVILRYLSGRAAIAAGDDKPLRDRFHHAAEAQELIRSLTPGQFIYQATLPTPAGFYRRYGLDHRRIRVADCRPDLIECLEGESGPELRIVDIKASPGLKLSHRIQAALYSLILSHSLSDWNIVDRRVSDLPAIWLANTEKPEGFDIRMIRPPMETFLEIELPRILHQPAGDAPWHIYYRCEWCEYFTLCRQEMRQTDSVSRMPYLSTHAKSFLAGLEPSVRTVPAFDRLLHTEDSGILDNCATLSGRQDRLALQADALVTDRTQVHAGSSLAMPKAEHVRLIFTLQREPVSGLIYAFGIYGQGFRDILGENPEPSIEVASSPDLESIQQLERHFIRSLYRLLKSVDDYNSDHSQNWAQQKTLQVYAFDSYERDFLIELLVRRLEDGEVAGEALRLFFFFQRPELIQAEDHPAEEVFFPITVVLAVVRDLFALPLEVSYRFADVARLLRPVQFAFDFQDNEFFSFELSNQLRSDAIFMVWHHRRQEYLAGISAQIRQRLRATNSVINGIRERLEGKNTLFAWPPKFKLPAGFAYRNPILSRLAFMTQYEAVVSYLALRQARMAPLGERLRTGDTIRLTYVGGSRFTIDPMHADVELEASGFPSWLLTEDTDQGERAALSYDDYMNRARTWVPRNSPLGLGAIAQVESTVETPNQALQLRTTLSPTMPELRLRGRYLLHPRYTDFNSAKAITELSALDTEPAPHFLKLVTSPSSCLAGTPLADSIRGHARRIGQQLGMTKSQLAAFDQILGGHLQLVWGPPGTGKTHFLALAILCLAEAHQESRASFRIVVSAFTHAAIDNCLRKLSDLTKTTGVFRELPVAKLKRAELPGMDAVEILDGDAALNWVAARAISVVGGTAWSIRKAFAPASVDLLVIDEGSQLKLPESAVIIRRIRDAGRLMIAGDDRQLPPIVQGDYPEPTTGAPVLHRSIFECLRSQDADGSLTSVLLENFRMNHALCAYPREQLYVSDYDSANPAIGCRRLDLNAGPDEDELADALLDPATPLVVAVLDGVQAAAENEVEADLVARTAVRLRNRMRNREGYLYPESKDGDAAFWSDGLFVVSPHHAQINAIQRALDRRRQWLSRPFVDTVDHMQGQECDAVIVSYGVADVEYAMNEKEFIYSLNRLNVSITRARSKIVVFLPRPLIEPPIQVFEDERTAAGVSFMQGLIQFARQHGQTTSYVLLGGSAHLLVSRVPDELPQAPVAC